MKLAFVLLTLSSLSLACQPPRWKQDPLEIRNADEDMMFVLALANHVESAPGDSLTFKKLEGPRWLSVDPDGMAMGIPHTEDRGHYTARFEVSNGTHAVVVTGHGVVMPTHGKLFPRPRPGEDDEPQAK